MSQNKVKHFSLPHYFTQVRGYNTRTNPLPLLHTGEEDPFPLLHTDERITIPRYEKPHTTLNFIKSLQEMQNTLNMQHIRVIDFQQNTHHHIM